MDLRENFPRSPYDMNAGLVMLCRTMDKARAHKADTLGDYHYDCPLDRLLFEFLGTDAESFAAQVNKSEGDEHTAEWVDLQFSRSQAEKDAFNNTMRHRTPQDGEARDSFQQWQKDLDRQDYFTYFDHLDADEGRF